MKKFANKNIFPDTLNSGGQFWLGCILRVSLFRRQLFDVQMMVIVLLHQARQIPS